MKNTTYELPLSTSRSIRKSQGAKWSASLIALAMAGIAVSQAQIVINTLGDALEENFNSIGSAANAVLPSGWRADRIQGPGPNYPVRQLGTWVDAGMATIHTNTGTTIGNAAGIWNLGASADPSDRAIGFTTNANESTGTQSGNLYAQFINNTGSAITSIELSYDVEKYRFGSNPSGFRFQLYYGTNGTDWITAGEDFETYFPRDQNSSDPEDFPVAVVPISNTLVFNTPIAAGETFYLAWNFSPAEDPYEGPARSQALAIDNISITAIPEPSTAATLIGVSIISMIMTRRPKP